MLTAASYGPAPFRGGPGIKPLIIIAIAAAAAIVLTAAFVAHAGVPLAFAGIGVALGALVLALARG